MSKYKPLDVPITRQEACLILDRKRFDGAVRSGDLVPLGKDGGGGTPVAVEDGALTAALLFDQAKVRELAKRVSAELATAGRDYRTEAKEVAKKSPPMTRRQITQHLGKKMTGMLIRSGVLQPYGTLTDTQTAAHTYDPEHVAKVINDLADAAYAESRLLLGASKVRVPA